MNTTMNFGLEIRLSYRCSELTGEWTCEWTCGWTGEHTGYPIRLCSWHPATRILDEDSIYMLHVTNNRPDDSFQRIDVSKNVDGGYWREKTDDFDDTDLEATCFLGHGIDSVLDMTFGTQQQPPITLWFKFTPINHNA